MSQQGIIFDANSFLKLLCHYDDGREMPLTAELENVGINPMLSRYVGMYVVSPEWSEEELDNHLHIRYEGRKVMSWQQQGDGAQPIDNWMDSPDAPKLL